MRKFYFQLIKILIFIYFINENQFTKLELNFQYWNNNYYFFNLITMEEDFQEEDYETLDKDLV